MASASTVWNCPCFSGATKSASCYSSGMDQIAEYVGYAYGALAGLRLILNGVKAIAGLNGSEGAEDQAISKAEAFLDQLDAALSRVVRNPAKPKAS